MFTIIVTERGGHTRTLRAYSSEQQCRWSCSLRRMGSRFGWDIKVRIVDPPCSSCGATSATDHLLMCWG